MNTSDHRHLDVRGNRRGQSYRFIELLLRVLWALVTPFFRFSPRMLWAWRRLLLRAFGAQIGSQVHVYPTVRISMPWNLKIGDMAAVGDRAILYALGEVKIGPRATVSQYAHLCAGTHDISRADRPLLKLPIYIGADSWIATDAFVGPGVRVGPRAIVGARAVVTKDVKAGHVVVGNPAKTIKVLNS